MAAGIGGGVGSTSDRGWKPFSSAMYFSTTGIPSGEVYWKEP